MNLTAEIIGTWVAAGGLILAYFKDKGQAQKDLGRLEQKVTFLEREIDKVDTLTRQINETNIHLTRLESKIDTLVSVLENKYGNSHNGNRNN